MAHLTLGHKQVHFPKMPEVTFVTLVYWTVDRERVDSVRAKSHHLVLHNRGKTMKNGLSQSVQSGSGLIGISYLKPDPFPLLCLMQFIAVHIQTLVKVPLLNHSDSNNDPGVSKWTNKWKKLTLLTLNNDAHTDSWHEIKTRTWWFFFFFFF